MCDIERSRTGDEEPAAEDQRRGVAPSARRDGRDADRVKHGERRESPNDVSGRLLLDVDKPGVFVPVEDGAALYVHPLAGAMTDGGSGDGGGGTL